MKRLLATLATAGSVALVSPLAFQHAVDGCHDDSYRFSTPQNTSSQIAGAKAAKSKFCYSARVATENARLTW
jgi:hypothetical protein